MLATYQQAMRLFSREVRLFLFACAVAGFTYFGIYALLLNLYLLRLGYDPAIIGLVNGVGPLAMAIAALPAGALGQRWGNRRALLVGFSLLMIGFGLLPLVEFLPVGVRVSWLLATYLVAWLGGTFFVVITPPFLMSATSEQERNHVFAIQGAVMPVAGFVGNLVGGLLPGAFAALRGVTLDQPAPYRFSLWIAAALLFFAVLAIAAMRPESIAPPQAQTATRDTPPYSLIVMLALVFLFRIAGEWVMRIFFNVYLDASLHVSTMVIGALVALGQLLGIAALSAPLVMARWGAVRTIGWGTVGMACAFLPLILLRHWVGAGLGFIAMMTLLSVNGPVFNLFSQACVAPRWRNLVSGTMFMAMGASVAAMAFGGGYLIVVLGYRTLFLVAAGLTLAGALVFFAYFQQARGELARLPAEVAS